MCASMKAIFRDARGYHPIVKLHEVVVACEDVDVEDALVYLPHREDDALLERLAVQHYAELMATESAW
jgi:hypothetical protein